MSAMIILFKVNGIYPTDYTDHDTVMSMCMLTRIILHPLSALSLDEGLNALSGKTPSAAIWFRRPIKCQILARMRISDFIYFRL
jgi:hypothetical protein